MFSCNSRVQTTLYCLLTLHRVQGISAWPRLNNSFGGDFHYRLNPGNFVYFSRKGWFFPLMDGSTTAWAVLFTDGTLKRRGFHKFSSITLVETLTAVMHLFSLINCHKWRQIAVEQSSFRNGSAIRTHKFTSPLWRALYITTFPTYLLQTTAWKWVLIFCGNYKTEQRNRPIKNVSPIFHISQCPLP